MEQIMRMGAERTERVETGFHLVRGLVSLFVIRGD
jgi:hypothetical protein